MVSLQLCRIDARIARILAAMQQGGFEVGEASARAYRSIMVFSLKSFIGVCIVFLGCVVQFSSSHCEAELNVLEFFSRHT